MEQFLYGLFPDAKYYFLTSPGVYALISDQNLEILRTRESTTGDPDWLPTEQVVVYQTIEPVNFGNGLTGIWNHTLLIPIHEYIRLTNLRQRLEGFFYHAGDAVPQPLPAIDATHQRVPPSEVML